MPEVTEEPGVSSTPTPTAIEGAIDCGLMDINGDNNLKIEDFSSFASVYLATCQESRVITTGCGGKDTNGDGVINLADLLSLASRYHPATGEGCGLF